MEVSPFIRRMEFYVYLATFLGRVGIVLHGTLCHSNITKERSLLAPRWVRSVAFKRDNASIGVSAIKAK